MGAEFFSLRNKTVRGGAPRRVIAVVMCVAVPLLSLAGPGNTQQGVQIQGIIQAVDCQAQTVVLSAPTGSNTVTAAAYTAVLINSTSVPFCTLADYIGVPATAWLIASGNQFTATQISVTGPTAAPPPPDLTAGVSVVPIWGVVLGTILVAGFVYLLVRGPDGGYYRYPYYGEYYRRYYHPEYRPYTGAYPASAPIISVASAIAGTVLGIVAINGLQYILSRDAAGHLYRYPYYGPYHQVYYRPAYRPYQGPYTNTGAYRNAPLRQGDPRWDTPLRTVPPTPGAPNPSGPMPTLRPPAPQPVPVRPPAPAYQQRIPQVPPAYQPPPPQRPSVPAYQPPAPQRPSVPAYQLPPRSGPQCGGPNQPPCPSAAPPAPAYRPSGGAPPAPAYRPPAPSPSAPARSGPKK